MFRSAEMSRRHFATRVETLSTGLLSGEGFIVNINVKGSFRSIFLYDLSEEIRLDTLRTLLGTPPASREPAFRHLAPEYVRFERPAGLPGELPRLWHHQHRV